MIQWLIQNLASVLVVLILAFIVFLAVRSIIRQRKNGKCSCGCDCSSCGGCSAYQNYSKAPK